MLLIYLNRNAYFCLINIDPIPLLINMLIFDIKDANIVKKCVLNNGFSVLLYVNILNYQVFIL